MINLFQIKKSDLLLSENIIDQYEELQYNYLMPKWYSKDLGIYHVILYLSVWMSPKKVELQTLSL